MGSVNLDNTGSGNAITLSSDGTSLLLNGTAIGGGGGSDPDLYRDNAVSATTPTASGDNAVAIGDDAVASGVASVAFGQQTDATGTNAIALGSGAQATQPHAVAIRGTASARESTAIGVNNVANGAVAAGEGSMALQGSYASGADSFAAAIANNTSSYGATGSHAVSIGNLSKSTHYSGIAIGHQNIVNGNRSASIGGRSNTAGSDMSGIIGGYGNNTSNQYTFIGGGYNNVASGLYSAVIGGYDNDATDQGSYATGMWANSSIKGKWAHGAAGHLGTTTSGSQQSGHYVLISNTTDATAEALTTDNSTAGTSNQIVLPNNSAYAFSGTIVAREKASEGTDCAAWKVEGLIRREGSAGTTVLVNSATTVINNASSWGMALTADTTNGCLKIAVTGAASTNIRWVGTITTSELIYA